MICNSFRECFVVDLRTRESNITAFASFKRSFFEGRVLALVLIRLSQWFYKKKAIWRIAPLLQRLNEVLTGVECHLNATVGEGLFIAHTQNIVIGAGVLLGKNVTLYNGVTLGAGARGSESSSNRYPIIENSVTVYTGAKILGPVTIGSRAIVGANAVVLQNIPTGQVAVGVPAKIKISGKKSGIPTD